MGKLSVSILYAFILSSSVAFAQNDATDIAAQVVPQVLGRSPEEIRPLESPSFLTSRLQR